MNISTNFNEIYFAEICNQLFDIEEELAKYIEKNITGNDQINDIYPYASFKLRERDTAEFKTLRSIFLFLSIISEQEDYLKNREQIRSFSRSLVHIDKA